MSQQQTYTIMIRLAAELTIKSARTRNAFLRRLRRNIRDALKAGPTVRVEFPARHLHLFDAEGKRAD